MCIIVLGLYHIAHHKMQVGLLDVHHKRMITRAVHFHVQTYQTPTSNDCILGIV